MQAHEEIESQCNVCHSKFDDQPQRALCLDCHEDIDADIQTHRGYHGLNMEAQESECASCHGEHKGRDADITGLVPELFEHADTNFRLEGAHANLACSGCHEEDVPFRATNTTCSGCHTQDDTHDGALGSECASCHSTDSWRAVNFDHARETSFALLGGHQTVSCTSCHAGGTYEDTPTTCVGCHVEDDVHAGSRGSECESCHIADNWQTTEFSHELNTGFALIGAHEKLTCKSCHLAQMALA